MAGQRFAQGDEFRPNWCHAPARDTKNIGFRARLAPSIVRCEPRPVPLSLLPRLRTCPPPVEACPCARRSKPPSRSRSRTLPRVLIGASAPWVAAGGTKLSNGGGWEASHAAGPGAAAGRCQEGGSLMDLLGHLRPGLGFGETRRAIGRLRVKVWSSRRPSPDRISPMSGQVVAMYRAKFQRNLVKLGRCRPRRQTPVQPASPNTWRTASRHW